MQLSVEISQCSLTKLERKKNNINLLKLAVCNIKENKK